MSPVGSHRVCARHSPQSDRILVSAFIAHHTDTSYVGEQNGSSLPDLVVESPVAQSLDEDIVGILQDANLFGSNRSEDADRKTWAWEGMTTNQMVWNAQLTAYSTYFVLEEPLQRFAQLEVHFLGQTAYIVMTLDDFSRNVQAFDSVRINRALSQPLCVCNLLCLSVEDFDEVSSDDFALLLRLSHAFEVGEETSACIHSDDVQAQALVILHHILELVLAQHSVIYEDASQAVPDSAIEQNGCHATIHAS